MIVYVAFVAGYSFLKEEADSNLKCNTRCSVNEGGVLRAIQ